MAAPATTDGRAQAALALGVASLVGLIFPPLLIAGVGAIYLGLTSLRRITRSEGTLKGRGMALAGLALGVVGSLLSLVLPGFFGYVWIYAAFHNNQLPP
jgi:hypothetical protein